MDAPLRRCRARRAGPERVVVEQHAVLARGLAGVGRGLRARAARHQRLVAQPAALRRVARHSGRRERAVAAVALAATAAALVAAVLALQGNIMVTADFGYTIGTVNGKETSSMASFFDMQGKFLSAYPIKK